MALEPLGETEVAEYLVAKSSGASLLYQQSEGNPLFVVTVREHVTGRSPTTRVFDGLCTPFLTL
jgi:hypothetical protein